jgi:hypothetical protein
VPEVGDGQRIGGGDADVGGVGDKVGRRHLDDRPPQVKVQPFGKACGDVRDGELGGVTRGGGQDIVGARDQFHPVVAGRVHRDVESAGFDVDHGVGACGIDVAGLRVQHVAFQPADLGALGALDMVVGQAAVGKAAGGTAHVIEVAVEVHRRGAVDCATVQGTTLYPHARQSRDIIVVGVVRPCRRPTDP